MPQQCGPGLRERACPQVRGTCQGQGFPLAQSTSRQHEPCNAQALVTDLGTAELARSGGREALLFRENTLATKAIDEYMKLVARDYLQETLGEQCVCMCGGLPEA